MIRHTQNMLVQAASELRERGLRPPYVAICAENIKTAPALVALHTDYGKVEIVYTPKLNPQAFIVVTREKYEREFKETIDADN